MDWGFVLSVVITGMVVVFLALVILITIVSIIGKIFQSIDNSKKNKSSIVTPAKPNVQVKPVVSASVSSNDLTDEVVAAITAAINCVLSAEGNNKPFVIKSIKRATNRTAVGRNAWNMAGAIENTRAF